MLGVGDDGIYGDHGPTSTNPPHRIAASAGRLLSWRRTLQEWSCRTYGFSRGASNSEGLPTEHGVEVEGASVCPKPDRRAWASGPQAGSPRGIRVAKVATSECRSSVAGFE